MCPRETHARDDSFTKGSRQASFARHRSLGFLPHHISLSLPAFYFSNLQDIAKQVCIVKAVVFPVVRYRYESWTIRKAER